MTSTDRISGASSSLAIKAPCKVATTANITREGEQTIDGVAVVTGDRVLVKNQTDQDENGIYEVDTSAWGRTKDFDGARDAAKGTMVYVTNGSTNGNSFFQLTTTSPVIGTSNLAFTAVDIALGNVSSFMETVLDDTTAAAARATLGIGRESLTANRSYYVRSDGSNSNTGLADTSGGAWLTLQYALDFISQQIDFSGYSITVTCTGAFVENIIVPEMIGYGGRGYTQLTFVSSGARGSASLNCGTGIGIFAAIHSTPVTFKYFTHLGQDSSNGICAEADAGGVIAFQNPIFGAANAHCVSVHSSARIVFINEGYEIAGNFTTHWYIRDAGEIYIQPSRTVVLTGTPVASNAYIDVDDNGLAYLANTAWTGTMTGIKYKLGANGWIQHDTSINSIPTTLAGQDNRAPVKHRRPIRNGDFQVWQNGTSIAAAGSLVWTASGWGLYRTGFATGATVSKTSNPEAGSGYPQALRLQRDSGNASTAAMYLFNNFQTQDSIPFAGKQITLAIRCKKGANFSPSATCALQLITGTGTDESLVSGFTGQATAIAIDLLAATTSYNTLVSTPFTLATNVTQIVLLVNYTPVGTAGANDWIEIEFIDLFESPLALPHIPIPYAEELARCEFFEQVMGGDDADEYFASGAILDSGAAARFLLPYKRPMRGVPTLTSSGNFQGYFPVTNTTADAASLSSIDASKSRMALSAVIIGTAGDFTLLKAKADTSARITLRAEIG